MILFNKAIILFALLIGLSAAIGSICADQYEAGTRAGYEKGLEDGIRLTNEVLSEEVK